VTPIFTIQPLWRYNDAQWPFKYRYRRNWTQGKGMLMLNVVFATSKGTEPRLLTYFPSVSVVASWLWAALSPAHHKK